jgi:hypothetical protein
MRWVAWSWVKYVTPWSSAALFFWVKRLAVAATRPAISRAPQLVARKAMAVMGSGSAWRAWGDRVEVWMRLRAMEESVMVRRT